MYLSLMRGSWLVRCEVTFPSDGPEMVDAVDTHGSASGLHTGADADGSQYRHRLAGYRVVKELWLAEV